MLLSLLSKIDRKRFDPSVISLMDKGIYGGQIEQLGIPVYSLGMLSGTPTIASAIRVLPT